MAKKTKLEIDRLAKLVGRHRIEEKLFLRVRPGRDGTRALWEFRYTFDGQKRAKSLGVHPNVSPASVFDQAHECRKLLAQRIDPLEHDRQEKAKAALSRSFQEMAEDYVRFRSREIAAHTAYSWRTGLQRHVYPKIGRVPVNNIGTIEANSVLLPMCRETPVMAEKMRFLGKKILEHAVANNCRLPQPNPFEFKGNLEHNARWVSRRDHVTKHCPALPWQQIGVFMEDLRRREEPWRSPNGTNRDFIAARALEFLILTGVRISNACTARWKDIDLDRRIWTIPGREAPAAYRVKKVGTHMKTKRTHRVPLSSAAIALLRRQEGEHPEFVFPGRKELKSTISSTSVARVLLSIGYVDEEGEPIVPHGFRTSFRGWSRAIKKYELDVVEMAIAHDERSKTQRAYDRDDLLEDRRPLMEDWAQFCSKPYAPDEKVIPIRRTQGE